MAVTTAKSPTTCANDASYGSIAWNNPGKAVSSNNDYAIAGLLDTEISQYLKATDFSIDIPAASVVHGIEASFEMKSSVSTPGVMRVVRVRIVKGGAIGSTEMASGEYISETGEEIKTYGGQSEKWGESWTAADVNASNFGVVIAVDAIGDPVTMNCSLDHVTLMVHYGDATMGEVVFPANTDVRIQGTITADGMVVPAGAVSNASVATNAAIARNKLAQENLVRHFIPWEAWRVWDAFATPLPGTSATDDLGLIGGTFGTATPTIQTYDVKTVGATNLYARCVVALPINYVAGETAKIRAHAGMKTTVADNACTLDFVAYESDEEEGLGADLVSTAAQSINSLVLADYDYTLTSGTLSPGDMLDIRMHVAVNDGAAVTAVIAMIGSVELLLDVQG